MSSEWVELSLGECLLKVVDNRGKTPPLADDETPYGLIEINAIVGQDKSPNYAAVRKYVSAETYDSWFRAGHPIPGDLLFSTVGSIAEVAMFNGGGGCIAQNLVGLRPNKKIVSPSYLYYTLVNPAMRLKLRTLDISSVQPSIKVPHLLATKIQVPSLELQEQIGNTLSALDDRITLLRETNATLEAIAQALFKSWFVDFDPVRAKMAGRAPEGMDEATAALFPDALEETELGLVPKGWRVMPFLEACDLQGGAQPPASTFVDTPRDGYVRLLQIRDFSTDAHKTYIPDTTKLKKATEDDVLLGRYGSASGDKAKDSLGRVCRGLSGAYNVALMKLVPIHVGREFALQLVNDPRFYNYLQGVSSKAVQSGFSKSELGQYKVVVPPQELSDVFEDIGLAFWERLKHGVARQREMAELRDTLLPRLISGQLRLPEAQAQLKEALA